MAKKYKNYTVSNDISKENDSYTTWTNDVLRKVIASKTVIRPGKSTGGHVLMESEVVYIFLSGSGSVEVVEYSNHEAGHGNDPSFGIQHKEKMDVYSGAVVFAEEGDYIRVNNTHEQENLTYIRVFDRDGWRQGS